MASAASIIIDTEQYELELVAGSWVYGRVKERDGSLEDFYKDWSELDSETQKAFASISGAVDKAAGEGLALVTAA